MVMVDDKIKMMPNKCTSVIGHFDGHGGAPGQYRRHPQCGMSRATLEATGRRYWVTNSSVTPRRLPGQQANKQQSTNTPTFLAILMAMGSRASLEATSGRRHWASIMSNNINWTWLRRFFMFFIVKIVEKGRGSMLRPLFSIGV
jgi:hypothetical protein